MGQVNSVNDTGSSSQQPESAASPLAAGGKQPKYSTSVPHEIRQLQSAFKVSKKGSERGPDQPKISSEVFLSSLSDHAVCDYIEPQDETVDLSAEPAGQDTNAGGQGPEYFVNNLIRDGDVVHKIYEHVKSKMRASPIDLDDFLEENNFQKNTENLQGSTIDALMIKKAMQEVVDDMQIGFKTPESHLEMLKASNQSARGSQGAGTEQSRSTSSLEYDKYFLVPEKAQEESRWYYRQIMAKQIYILYSIYLQRQKLNDEERKDFFDYIAGFLKLPAESEAKDNAEGGSGGVPPCDSLPPMSVGDARAQIGLDVGLKFSVNILKELGKVNKGLLVSSLECLLETLKQYRPGALYSCDRVAYQLDENLNEARDFLVEEVHQALAAAKGGRALSAEEQKLTQVAMKIILMLGIVRSNIEDFLIVLSTISSRSESKILTMAAGKVRAVSSDEEIRAEIKAMKDITADRLSFLDLTEEIRIISTYYGLGARPDAGTDALSPDKPSEDPKDEPASAVKNYKVGQQNLLTSSPILILMSSGHLLELRNSAGDRMIADEEHFYVYKESGVKGFNAGIYKLSSASSLQSAQGAAFRMSGRILHSNTSQPFVDRLTQELDASMVLIDGKIYMKYEELSKPAAKEKSTTKEEKEKEEAEQTEAKEAEEDAVKSSRLMIIDAATLEPLRAYGGDDGVKDEPGTKPQASRAVPLKTCALENIPSWKADWQEYRKQEVVYDGLPMLTEGGHLYVFGRQRKKKNDQTEQVVIIINIYKIEREGELPEFRYLRQVTLLKNGFEPFVKESNSQTFVGQQAQWATNGQVLLCFGKKNKLYWFDMQTGRKISKSHRYWTASDFYDEAMIHFNPQTNQFTRMLTRDHSSEFNRFWIFNYSNFKVQNQEGCEERQLAKLKGQLGTSASPMPFTKNLNVIKNLMKKPKKVSRVISSSADQGVTPPLCVQRCLILDIINHFSQEQFAVDFEEIQNKSGAKRLADILKLFKFQNCTYLTESVFLLLADNLMSTRHVLSGPLTSSPASISLQYSLLYLLNLTSANFKALNHCQIKLSFLLEDELAGLPSGRKEKAISEMSQDPEEFWAKNPQIEKGYKYFMTAYECTIVAVVEKGQHRQALKNIEDPCLREELSQLWREIERVCKEIIDGSVSLLHQDPSSMVEILLDGLNKPSQEMSLQNICVQISYLNLKDNLKKVIDHPKISLLSSKICELFSGPLVERAYKERSAQLSNLDKLVEQTTKSYLLNYTQLVLQRFCEEQENMVSRCKKLQSQQNQILAEAKGDTEPADASPLPPCERGAEAPSASLDCNRFQAQFVEVTELAYDYLKRHLQTMLETAEAESKVAQAADPARAQRDKQQKQIETLNVIGATLANRDVFYETVLVFNQAFALLKLDSFARSQDTVRFVERMMNIITICAQFQEIRLAGPGGDQDGEGLKIRYMVPEFMVVIDKLQRQISWLLAQTAFRMIRVKKPSEEPDSQEEKTKEKLTEQQKKNLLNIQESSLLSGGVEPRHLASVLSKDRQQLLKTYLMIIGDEFLSQSFESPDSPGPENSEDDKILQAIIQAGRDESTDSLITCLQRSLETKMPMVPFARGGGPNGLRMARAAFALLIKFSDMLEDFVSVVDQVQFFKEIESGKSKDVPAIIAFLKELPQFPAILEKFEQASRMRSWINDRKQRLSLDYEKEVREEVLQKKKKEAKERAQKEREAAKAAAKVAGAGEGSQIDSSAKPGDAEASPEPKEGKDAKDAKTLTEEEKSWVEDEAYNRLEKELDQIFSKIQQKAEFLIKLQIPLQFLNKKATGLAPEELDGERAAEGKGTKKKSGSSGVQSCVTCVLSLLQASVQCGKIQEQVELIYQNACKRVTGLKIIADLVQLDAPQYILEDILNWFCAALRANKNKIAHYMDDIKGEGTYLENKTRMYFFQILAEVVKRLRDCKWTPTIKYLLRNTLEWKFMGRDHQKLLELGLLKVLHTGDGSKDNLLRRCWGKNLQLGTKQSLDEQSTSRDVIEYFENLLVSIIARIVDPSALEPEPSAKKKKNQLSLQKAKSVINEDVSETLLAQGFDIIFKELNRYVRIMNNLFRGIDWSTYVKSRTAEDASKSLNSDYLQDRLLDEEQELERRRKGEGAATEEKKPKDQEASGAAKQEVSSEEKLKQEAEARQKQRVEKQLSQIDKIYQESFLKRLIKLVEIFTSVQSSKALQNQASEKSKGSPGSDYLGQYHINLLARLATPGHLATLLNLLVLASPQVKAVVLKIIQQLVRVHQISHKVFDQAVSQIVAPPASGSDHPGGDKAAQVSEASVIYHSIKPTIAEFKSSPFLKFLYQYLYSIRSKMWSKMHLESEGAYAVSAELIRTIRFIYEENHDSAASQNYIWRQEIDRVFSHLFASFGAFRAKHPIEVEVIMGLIRGCEYQAMIPYAPGVVNEPKDAATSDAPPQGSSGSAGSQSSPRAAKKYVQIIGFVHKRWLQRGLDWPEEDKRVHPAMRDSNQKVLCLLYDPKNLSDASNRIYEPQNLTLISDLSGIGQELAPKRGKKGPVENPIPGEAPEGTEAAKGSALGADKRQFFITSDILNTILRESKILSKDSSQDGASQDIHVLSQKTLVMKLIHHQLQDNTEGFLKSLKDSDYYQQLLRFVCQESSSRDGEASGTSNQITLIDWLEQRCAAIRLHACENQTCLMKQQEVKVSLVKDQLYVQTQDKQSKDKNDFRLTAIQLVSAINYQAFEEKKDFKLVQESDVAIQTSSEHLEGDNKNQGLDDDQITETNDVVLVRPELLQKVTDLGLDVLNQSKSIITTGVDLSSLVRLVVEKQSGNPEKYANLAQKTVFLVDKEEFDTMADIMGAKSQELKAPSGNAALSPAGTADCTPFEESLIQELAQYGGFSRAVAEKIIAKEGTLEEKTLHFSQVVKQIKDGLIDVKELEEQRLAELQKQENEGKASANSKKKRRNKSRVPQKHFDRPEEKGEILNLMRRNVHNFINREDRDGGIEDFNDRYAYYQKVNVFAESEALPAEYEAILKRLFSMYCRQIFWSLIQNDEVESIFGQIWDQADEASMVSSFRSFCNFIKVIGNECFITNNKRYILSFRGFLKKVVQTCCKKDSKYKSLLKVMIKEAFIESYHEHFAELTGDSSEFNKHIYEYFQSESKAEQLMNPIVLNEILTLVFEHDVSIIFSDLVDIVSLYTAVCMYFAGDNDLKSKVFEQIIRILELARKSATEEKGEKLVSLQQVSELINLKIFATILTEFGSSSGHSAEEAQSAKQLLRDTSAREPNGFSRKDYERHVLLYREQLHQKYIECDQSRRDTARLIIELAYKLRELSEIEAVDVYYHFQTNLVSYMDLQQRSLALLSEQGGEHSSLNTYLTFYNSLEAQKKIYSHDVPIKNPDEGCDVHTMEICFCGEDAKQLVEKVLVRLDSDSQFSSQGAAVLITSDADGKNFIALFNKTQFQKDQALTNVFTKGKSFFVHYPVYPNYNYTVSLSSQEPKFDLMTTQQYEQFDSFTNLDRFGTLYLGGGHRNLHQVQPGDFLKPYRNHLDIRRVNFGKSLMIILLETGEVYGLGISKSRHFADYDQARDYQHEQQIPFYDTKDKVETIETYKRCTVAVTKKGRVYAVGAKLKKMLKIQNDRFGFYQLPLEDPREEGEEEAKEEGKAGEGGPEAGAAKQAAEKAVENETLKAKNVWISKCNKAQSNFVIYCLFENTESGELELYSIGRNQGGGLLGLGDSVTEALSFKKMSFKLPAEKEGGAETEVKIKSVEGVDLRCGLSHTIIGLNNYEHVFVLGCYDKASQSHEEINHVPKPLKLCESHQVMKFDTARQRTVIVAKKKDSDKVQVMIGQFAPIAKEDSFKSAQFDLDLSGKGPTKVTQLYVREGNEAVYVSTSGSFQLDPYDTAGADFQRGFKAQGLKQSFSGKLPATAKQAPHGSKKNSGLVLKLSPDYGFFENDDFIKHNQADWDKFKKSLHEYKEVLEDEPESIKELEAMFREEFSKWLKDDSFHEICTFWRNAKEKNDLEAKGFKSKKNEKINEQVSVECKKLNIGLYATYCSQIWGALSTINKQVPRESMHALSMLSTFMKHRSNIPWCVLNKHVKIHLGTLQTDGDNISIHVNRKKAQDFAEAGQVDLKGEHTIFAQVKKKLEESRYRGMHINSSDKKAWFVKFIGEYALDEGGLFRESLSEITAELKSNVLPLLLPSKNQQSKTGIDMDMFVLNPGASTEPQLKMMEFLGALMGMSIRSGILLDINISRFVWKQIVGDELTKEDIRFIDALFYQDLETIQTKSKELSDEEFASAFGETHTMSTLLSDDSVVDLVENGRNIPLTRALAQSYCDKAAKARLEESKQQVEALAAGIDKTFDRRFLRMMNWKFLEYKIVGMNEVSVERLKQITSYRHCSETHEVVKRYWQVMEGFSNDEKISYLRFVWGRTRLPLKEEEGVELHTVQLDENADSKRLPVGRTCFFRLELPPYESLQQMKAKLTYSINHCRAIDADFDRAGAPNEEENPDPNNPGEHDDAADGAESEGSARQRRRRQGLFPDDESYGASGASGGGGEEEEE